MPIYLVNASMEVSCWTEVEAETSAQAIEIAKTREVAGHHIDNSYPADEFWHFDNDGLPQHIGTEATCPPLPSSSPATERP